MTRAFPLHPVTDWPSGVQVLCFTVLVTGPSDDLLAILKHALRHTWVSCWDSGCRFRVGVLVLCLTVLVTGPSDGLLAILKHALRHTWVSYWDSGCSFQASTCSHVYMQLSYMNTMLICLMFNWKLCTFTDMPFSYVHVSTLI